MSVESTWRRWRVFLFVAIPCVSIVASIAIAALAWPDDAPPLVVRVVAIDPGRSPSELEREVALPIARALREVPGVPSVATRSTEGRALVTCTLEPDQDGLEVLRAIRARLDDVVLPEGVRASLGGAIAASPTERFFTLAGPDAGARARLARARIERIDGVLDVELCGASEPVVRVELDPARLAMHGVSVGEVLAALRENREEPAGRIAAGERTVTLRVGAEPIADRQVRAGLRVGALGRVEQVELASCRAWRSGEERTVAGLVRIRDASAAPAVEEAIRGVESVRAFGAGARVTTGTILSPSAPSIDAIGRALQGVPGAREALIESEAGSMRVALAWEHAETRPEALRDALQAIPGIVFVPDDALRARVIGSDRARDRELASQACELLARRADVHGCVVLGGEAPEIALEIDRERAASLGVSSAALAETIRALSDDGIVAARWRERDVEHDVVIHVSSARLDDASTLRSVLMGGAGGARVPLSELVTIRVTSAPVALETVDGVPSIELAVDADPAVSDELAEALATEVELPPDVRIEPPR